MRSMTWIDVLGASTVSIFMMWLVQCSISCLLYTIMRKDMAIVSHGRRICGQAGTGRA